MIPKRAISALLTTVLGLVLLFSFKTPDTTRLTASGAGAIAPVIAGTTGATGTTGTSHTTGTTGTTGTSHTTDSGAAAVAPTPASGGTYADGTFTGATISTRYGDVQVAVVISGGTLSDVTPLHLPSGDGHSRRIAQVAEPILREEALTAQSANIDLLSGATYTSEAYAESLQSALDHAHA